ncbi:hypothetical protein cyc_02732 [Cyclospora cayetanensis]|uniref:Uncharacterized protein n=1 Tax=Cyclospora cayetanensis TaxID=88456 RepID=A0A1D3CY93_9EIME|nr:hypothetical protein cyc_02732 [Cyclospora cayetanensis]
MPIKWAFSPLLLTSRAFPFASPTSSSVGIEVPSLRPLLSIPMANLNTRATVATREEHSKKVQCLLARSGNAEACHNEGAPRSQDRSRESAEAAGRMQALESNPYSGSKPEALMNEPSPATPAFRLSPLCIEGCHVGSTRVQIHGEQLFKSHEHEALLASCSLDIQAPSAPGEGQQEDTLIECQQKMQTSQTNARRPQHRERKRQHRHKQRVTLEGASFFANPEIAPVVGGPPPGTGTTASHRRGNRLPSLQARAAKPPEISSVCVGGALPQASHTDEFSAKGPPRQETSKQEHSCGVSQTGRVLRGTSAKLSKAPSFPGNTPREVPQEPQHPRAPRKGKGPPPPVSQKERRISPQNRNKKGTRLLIPQPDQSVILEEHPFERATTTDSELLKAAPEDASASARDFVCPDLPAPMGRPWTMQLAFDFPMVGTSLKEVVECAHCEGTVALAPLGEAFGKPLVEPLENGHFVAPYEEPFSERVASTWRFVRDVLEREEELSEGQVDGVSLYDALGATSEGSCTCCHCDSSSGSSDCGASDCEYSLSVREDTSGDSGTEEPSYQAQQFTDFNQDHMHISSGSDSSARPFTPRAEAAPPEHMKLQGADLLLDAVETAEQGATATTVDTVTDEGETAASCSAKIAYVLQRICHPVSVAAATAESSKSKSSTESNTSVSSTRSRDSESSRVARERRRRPLQATSSSLVDGHQAEGFKRLRRAPRNHLPSAGVAASEVAVGPLGPLHERVVIFDWDDTFFPNSWVASRGLTLSSEASEYTAEASMLKKLTRSGRKVLRAAASIGSVLLITNAAQGWIDETCKKFLPGLWPTVRSLRRISARFHFDSPACESPFLWKRLAFKEEMDRHLTEHKQCRTVLSIGDGPHEREALFFLQADGSANYDFSCKSLKLIDMPSLRHLHIQHSLLLHTLEDLLIHDGPLDLCVRGPDGMAASLGSSSCSAGIEAILPPPLRRSRVVSEELWSATGTPARAAVRLLNMNWRRCRRGRASLLHIDHHSGAGTEVMTDCLPH